MVLALGTRIRNKSNNEVYEIKYVDAHCDGYIYYADMHNPERAWRIRAFILIDALRKGRGFELVGNEVDYHSSRRVTVGGTQLRNLDEIIVKKSLMATNRPGMSDLIRYLDDHHYFDLPASIKYHNNFSGGLVRHSVSVLDLLIQLNDSLGLSLQNTAIAITALLHDLCKIDNYTWNPDTKEWCYKENPLPGHATKSINLINRFIELTDEEMIAIRFHMGAYDPDDIEDKWRNLSDSYKEYPLAYWLHVADMRDSHNL